MKGTRIAPLRPFGPRSLEKGPFLLLVEPERVPPHLALIDKGLYFSLSVKGVETDKDAASILEGLRRKGKTFLMIGLKLPSDPTSSRYAFRAYEGSGPPENSCLRPILDRFGPFGSERIDTVHALIAELEAQQALRSPYFFFRPEGQQDRTELWIPPYQALDVEAHLQKYRTGTQEG